MQELLVTLGDKKIKLMTETPNSGDLETQLDSLEQLVSIGNIYCFTWIENSKFLYHRFIHDTKLEAASNTFK